MLSVQCRMARAGLGWSIADLALKSDVGTRTVIRFENGEPVKLETVEALRQALVEGGALFLDLSGRVGVTVKAPKAQA
jgi:transcriptional regulator with XRE-family HTH domain